MTKILNFALKIKGVVGRVVHAKSSDPATLPPPKKKIWNVHLPWEPNNTYIISSNIFTLKR